MFIENAHRKRDSPKKKGTKKLNVTGEQTNQQIVLLLLLYFFLRGMQSNKITI